MYGSRDGSGGFVAQQSEKGIANQGWKGSRNSVVHRNGAFAKAPIALVEVRGYVYQAKWGLAELDGACYAFDCGLQCAGDGGCKQMALYVKVQQMIIEKGLPSGNAGNVYLTCSSDAYIANLRVFEDGIKLLYMIPERALSASSRVIRNWLLAAGAFSLFLAFSYPYAFDLKILSSNLREEFSFIQNVLSIQEKSYESTIQVHYGMDVELLNLYVPKFILQPVVENAVIHSEERISKLLYGWESHEE